MRARARRHIVPAVGPVLALSVCILLTACHSPREVRIVSTKNPPEFKVSGGISANGFTVGGPFPDLATLRQRAKPPLVWMIHRVDADAPTSSFPTIHYGILPPGFREDKGPPPALEPGKFYNAWSVITRDSSFQQWGTPLSQACVVCFQAAADKVVEVPCDNPN